MNFERGKDPKTVLRIGRRQKAIEIIREILDSRVFYLADERLIELIKKTVKEKTGLSVEAKWDSVNARIDIRFIEPITVISSRIVVKTEGNEL